MDELARGAQAAISADDAGGGRRVVRIAGELDISNVPAVEARLHELTAGAAAPLTFELSALEFLDSSGLAMLLRAAERVGGAAVREPSAVARQVIETAGLADVLGLEG